MDQKPDQPLQPRNSAIGDGDVGDPFAAFHEWTGEADQKAFAALATDVALSSAASGDDKAEN